MLIFSILIFFVKIKIINTFTPIRPLGSIIRELRKSPRWKQCKLASECDMDFAVLSRIENENIFPKTGLMGLKKLLLEYLMFQEKN